ncbi:MAG: hypothetical protein JWQ11_2985, partial [Rhizobacter sp.]|nr:hypothetical protein [Rhizobacter sp.]
TQRHIARGMANASRQSIIGIAAMVMGALAAAKSRTTDGGSAMMAGGQAYAIQGQLNFSREVEREADRVGFGVLTGAGFAPSGMASMFEKLEQASHLNDSNSYPYLRSHPLTSERIGDARARLGAVSGTLPALAVDTEHLLIAARARVMMDTRVDALRRWQALDSDRASNATPGDRIANAASSAMASSQLREWARADAAFATTRTLLAAMPAAHRAASDRLLALMTAQSMIERGDVTHAAEALRPYANDGSRPMMILQAQMALAGTSADGAAVARSADTLNVWVTQHPADALAWTVLGQSWERLGQKLRAVRADAESHAALGDLPGAIDRFRAGQRMARGPGVAPSEFIEASVIDARLRDVEIANKQIEADEKKG